MSTMSGRTGALPVLRHPDRMTLRFRQEVRDCPDCGPPRGDGLVRLCPRHVTADLFDRLEGGGWS